MFANTDLLISSLSMFQNWNIIDVASIMAPRFHRINIFYSSPEYYTQMKNAQTKVVMDSMQPAQGSLNAGIEWTTKADDFFPYSDCPHCFWTGYFTSRQAFKRLERVSSAFLLAARQIESFPMNDGTSSSSPAMPCERGYNCDQPLYQLEDALGVAQHHDAVSGTAKQHVSNDYSKRLQAGINKAATFVEDKLRKLLVNDSHVLDNLCYCQLLNETVCAISQVRECFERVADSLWTLLLT
jgi:Alpha mannosidase middle domain